MVLQLVKRVGLEFILPWFGYKYKGWVAGLVGSTVLGKIYGPSITAHIWGLFSNYQLGFGQGSSILSCLALHYWCGVRPSVKWCQIFSDLTCSIYSESITNVQLASPRRPWCWIPAFAILLSFWMVQFLNLVNFSSFELVPEQGSFSLIGHCVVLCYSFVSACYGLVLGFWTSL